jgi:hypothetical protein
MVVTRALHPKRLDMAWHYRQHHAFCTVFWPKSRDLYLSQLRLQLEADAETRMRRAFLICEKFQ